MKANPHTIASRFIQYLKEQEQFELLPEIVQELREELYRNQDISVVSAQPLEKKEQEQLQKLLEKKWGEHRTLFYVDPALLSGLVVKFQDQVLDASGRSGLIDLREQLHS